MRRFPFKYVTFWTKCVSSCRISELKMLVLFALNGVSVIVYRVRFRWWRFRLFSKLFESKTVKTPMSICVLGQFHPVRYRMFLKYASITESKKEKKPCVWLALYRNFNLLNRTLSQHYFVCSFVVDFSYVHLEQTCTANPIYSTGWRHYFQPFFFVTDQYRHTLQCSYYVLVYMHLFWRVFIFFINLSVVEQTWEKLRFEQPGKIAI